MKKLSVYIDGFNVFYGRLKGTQYKWLDYKKLVSLMFPDMEIITIKFFTAQVKTRPQDIGKEDRPINQQLYWRALRTIKNLEIIEGFFTSHIINMTHAVTHEQVSVIKTEEKGTDVNLAVHLVNDAHKNIFDTAVVFSADSDLVEAVKIVISETHKEVTIVTPVKNTAYELGHVASSKRELRKGVIKASQFPDELQDEFGTITNPYLNKKEG